MTCAALLGVMIAFSPAAAEQAKPAEAEKPAEKLVCKKIPETGSLVKSTKVCATAAQWRRSADNHRENGQRLQDELRARISTQ